MVALAGTASGEKLPAVLLFKERNHLLGKRVESKLTSLTSLCPASANGWMTRDEYHRCPTHVYKAEDESRLLVVDSYKPHCSNNGQVCEQAIKGNMRESWTSWMKVNQPTMKWEI